MLEAVLGREIRHALRLLRPRVPHDGVLEIVTHDAEGGLAAGADRERCLGGAGGAVDAVGFASDGDGLGGLGLGGGAADFVDIGRA